MTIREHLETLPEPYRTQALENMRVQDEEHHTNNACKRVSSAPCALSTAFYWCDSSEGTEYWYTLYNRLNS